MSTDIAWIRVLIKVSKVISIQSDVDRFIVLTAKKTWKKRFTAVVVAIQPVVANSVVNIILGIYKSH
jgi:anti-anti-sigma regulatory factor